MNARDVETGWLHQQSLDGVTGISVECDHVDLTFEADATLTGAMQLIGEPAGNAPFMERSGSEVIIKQRGRYRGRVTPLIRVPVIDCPPTEVKLGKGDLSFRDVQADIVVKHGMGDVELLGGSGHSAASLGMGDIAVSGRAGLIALKLGMGDISVSACPSVIAVSLGKGDVSIAESGPDIEVKNGNGDVSVVRPLGGNLSINSGRGDVSVEGGNATGVSVRCGKGDIRSTVRLLTTAAAQAEATNTGEYEEFEDFEGFDDFDPTDSFSIGDLEFEASDDGVRIGRGDRNILRMGPDGIQISGSSREISLGPSGIRVGGPEPPSNGGEQFTFESGRGDIQVDLPSDLNVRVEVLATGDIQSDVPLVSVARPGPRGTMKRHVGVTDGPGNSPRANVRVRTKRGDVSLRSIRVQPRPEPAQQPSEDKVDRDEQARIILEALSRGDLSVNEAERLLEGLDRER